VPVPGSPEGRNPDEVVALAQGLGIPAKAAPSVALALAQINADTRSGRCGRVLICGSLYLAGGVLAENG